MNKNIVVVLSILLIITISIAQAPDTLWTRTYGGTDFDQAWSVQQTTDGGYIIVGDSRSFGTGYKDVYLIKTDSVGDTLWTKTYGGTSDDDYGLAIQQATDGGYIIAGATKSFGAGNFDVWLIKANPNGDTLWTKTYGGIYHDIGYSVQQTTDDGYIIAGATRSYGADSNWNVYLLKTDPVGDTLWTKIYGGTDYDEGLFVQQTTDGGYIIVGETRSFGEGGGDVYLIKTNPSGDTMWTRTYGGIWDDEGISVQQTTDGGYIIVGVKDPSGGGIYFDVYLLKTDATGDTSWTKTYGGANEDRGWSVQQTSDSGYIIAGFTMSFGAGSRDVWLLKTDRYGDTLWTVTYGDSNTDAAKSVQNTTDGGYIITGWTVSFGAGDADVWLIKTSEDTLGINKKKAISLKNCVFGTTIFSGSLVLPEGKKCKVYDVTGRTVLPDKIKPGIYFIEIDGVIIRKVIKIK